MFFVTKIQNRNYYRLSGMVLTEDQASSNLLWLTRFLGEKILFWYGDFPWQIKPKPRI